MQPDRNQDEELLLSRCGEKFDTPVKTWLPESVDAALEALALEQNKKRSEYLRDLLIDHIHGSASRLRTALGVSSRQEDGGIDEALGALAFAVGMSRDDYEEQVLSAHVFGHGKRMLELQRNHGSN
ncbi:hypothetical protein [Chitinimonas sp. BJB300]|uniref:hypothetical protein n=1 Tax=Chitinimonas sp. BJB300 TaxID=1559339 RepID=UPI000C1130C3|nr:hypothetical protein [Chitinimonas sp. BJB300]PHV12083.1 hypothetical protein CSQ89_07665 [Chitinimonas sp. BJB300]TSJ87313.1 hypothetical protein FG002_013790 [Chitinimonas sp. BJB300]